jgi:signal transduction histidine kinase/ActR/RegA family two-component response regulator
MDQPMKRVTTLGSPATDAAVSARTPVSSAAAIPATVSARVAADAFSAVFESSGEALMILDSAGIIHRVNARAQELLRLNQTAVGTAHLAKLLSSSPSDQISVMLAKEAAEVPKKAHSVDATLASGYPVRMTLRAVLPGINHLLLCVEEGSVVQRAESKWRHAEAELRTVLDSVQAGAVLLDPSGGVRFFSVRFGELFGLDACELGRVKSFDQLHEVVAPRFRDPAVFSAPWRSFLLGAPGPSHDELEIARPVRRVLERYARPVLDSGGRSVGWLELCSDVTSQRQLQSKMLQTEKMAALGHLVSGIAHELNNPLTAIMGYAQLLLGQDLTPQQISEAKRIGHEAERARRIVKNLLYFARENKSEHINVDLNEIVERTLALRSYELRVENIHVDCDLAPGLPHTMADPHQLQQVVLNLLVNAEQALVDDRGHGRIWIRTRHFVEGVGAHARDYIVLEIADDGPGVPSGIASRIFEPFVTSKPPGAGTGLGLSIVYGIVHQHGGEVRFENQLGAGARFVIELPVVPVVPAKDKVPVALALGAIRTAAASRILIVEDEPSVAQLIVDVLREQGHRPEAILDSQEALTQLSRKTYDLVICDLRMPRLDGRAFYEALIQVGSPLSRRIIFVTGDILAPRTLEFLQQYGLPYVAKPFLVEELKLAVNHALDSSNHEPSEPQLLASSRGRR